MKEKIRTSIEILFCVIIIGFLISRINIQETINIILNINLYWILIGIMIYISSLLITGYSLKVLFDSVKYTKFGKWMHFYLVSFSMGLVLPGRAGDLSIIYFAKKKGFDIGASTALTITDKLITLSVFGTIATLGFFTILQSSQLTIGLSITILCILIGLSLFTSIGRKVITKLAGKYADKFQGFYKTFSNLIKYHKDKIAINVLITLYRPIGNTLLMIVVLHAMNITGLSFFSLIIINAITLIVSLIPLTPNGLGIREGVGGYLFTQIGVPLEISLSMYVIILLMNYTTGIYGTVYYLFFQKKEA